MIQGHAQNQRPNQNPTLIEANFPQFDLVVASKKTKNYKHQTWDLLTYRDCDCDQITRQDPRRTPVEGQCMATVLR